MIGFPPTTSSARSGSVGASMYSGRRFAGTCPHTWRTGPTGESKNGSGISVGRPRTSAFRRSPPPGLPRLPVTRFSICSSQYTGVPWRPMFPPVPMCAIAEGASENARAVRRMSSASSPVTPATRAASNGATNSRRPSTLRACSRRTSSSHPPMRSISLSIAARKYRSVSGRIWSRSPSPSSTARIRRGFTNVTWPPRSPIPRIASIAFGTETAVMWLPLGSVPRQRKKSVWYRSGTGNVASAPNIASIAANLFARSWVRPPKNRLDCIFDQNV